MASQLPVDHWHEVIANATVAGAILDRLVHKRPQTHADRRQHA